MVNVLDERDNVRHFHQRVVCYVQMFVWQLDQRLISPLDIRMKIDSYQAKQYKVSFRQ